MKQQSLIYQAWGIRAVLNCQPDVWPAQPIDPSKPMKWQTRRIVKPQPVLEESSISFSWAVFYDNGVVHTFDRDGVGGENWNSNNHPTENKFEQALLRTPYENPIPKGQPGSRVWCRETWGLIGWGGFYRDSASRFQQCPSPLTPAYRADHAEIWVDEFWRPSIHMPRWASRIDQIIKCVRVERVQDITAGDAVAEGMQASESESECHKIPGENVIIDGAVRVMPAGFICCPDPQPDISARDYFAAEWDEINSAFKPSKTNPYTGAKEDCMVAYPWADVQNLRVVKGVPHYTVGNPFTFVYDLMRTLKGAVA